MVQWPKIWYFGKNDGSMKKILNRLEEINFFLKILDLIPIDLFQKHP